MNNKKHLPITSSDMSDVDFVQLAIKNTDEYVFIVERYEKPLLRYIRRLGCKNNDDAKDILQEVFLKAYINLNSYNQGLKFSSWLYRITHNETISYFRRINVRPQILMSNEEIQHIVDEGDIMLEAERKYDAEQIHKALKNIDVKYREVLILKFLEDKSYAEISDILKIPAGTVAIRINRGKQKLKTVLKSTYTTGH